DGTVVLGGDINTPSAITVRGGRANGSNTTGGNITFDASNGTGTGGSGDIIFRTAAANAASNNPVQDANSGVKTGASVSSLSWSHTVTSAQSNLLLIVG